MFITVADLAPFAEIDVIKATAMIEDAEASALIAAPCLSDPTNPTQPNPALTDHQTSFVRSVLRSAILRWNDAGSGAIVQQTAGPFSETIDASRVRRGMFWPSEIDQLKSVCATINGTTSGGAFAIDMLSPQSTHLGWCSAALGAEYCSCGVDIAGHPIYEFGG